MSNQKPTRQRRENRPTDPFGGPAKRGNTISFTLVVVAFAIFFLIQWSNGDIGKVLQPSAAEPTVANTADPTPTLQAVATTKTAAATPAQATAAVAPTTKPTNAPTATTSSQARGVQTPRATTLPTPTANAPPVARASDLPTIDINDLPREAQETIALIDQGGPFPYDRDGITFQNRERLLPRQPEGYYREYTVITPGSSTRGARRIILGDEGEMYYTDDHYESFREILR